MEQEIREGLARQPLPAGAWWEVCRLSGGLESAVFRAQAREPGGARATPDVVVKRLCGRQRREAAIYRELWARAEVPPAARWVGGYASADADYLYLEYVEAVEWPWAERAVAAAVCRVLARLHVAPPIPARLVEDWNYEAELAGMAERTLEVATQVRAAEGGRVWRRLGDLRRVVAQLPRLRERLMAADATVVHGDVHPGNVLVRGGTARPEQRIALVDWGRARIGSPWEDVGSWLHSLGCWEPEARRRHDSLLQAYLAARHGAPTPITPAVRENYWFAAASNGLSGAILHHLAVAGDRAASPRAMREAQIALAGWNRVIRQVAAMLATKGRC